MTLKRDGGGWADVRCNRCGYYNSWEWEGSALEADIPRQCPQCETAPFLDAMQVRYRHWKALRRSRRPDFIGTIWANDTRDAIEHAELLDTMLEQMKYDC